MIAGGVPGAGDKKCLSATRVGQPLGPLERPVALTGGAGVGRPGELAMGSRVVGLERDAFGGDGELPDLGLVQAGSGLEHGQGASHLRLVA